MLLSNYERWCCLFFFFSPLPVEKKLEPFALPPLKIPMLPFITLIQFTRCNLCVQKTYHSETLFWPRVNVGRYNEMRVMIALNTVPVNFQCCQRTVTVVVYCVYLVIQIIYATQCIAMYILIFCIVSTWSLASLKYVWKTDKN